jgi:hypothetical protein
VKWLVSHWQKIGIDDAMTKDHHIVTALAIAPGDGRTICALTDFHRATWITRDGGKTWTSGWETGIAMDSESLAVSPTDANLVY